MNPCRHPSSFLAVTAPPLPHNHARYDGDGKRVQKSGGKLYWYGMSGDPLDETDLSGNLSNEYIFFGGQRIARRDYQNNVSYYFSDHLGTARIVANASGSVLDDSDFYPFGGERVITSSSGNNYKFTGKERDSESGLDNFGARYNSSSFGRFMSPDPANAGAFNDSPQSWNAYSYVSNNPLNATDPDGLDCVYLSDDQRSATVKSGNCRSDNDNGIFVDGTVKSLSLAVTDQGDVLNIGYRPDDGGDLILHPENLGQDASGLSAGVYDFHPWRPDSNTGFQSPSWASTGVLALARLGPPTFRVLPPQAKVAVIIAAAAAYLGYRAYIHFSSQNEQERIRAAAEQVGVDVHALGTAIEAYKQANNLSPDTVLSWKTIIKIAQEVKAGDWWSGVKK